MFSQGSSQSPEIASMKLASDAQQKILNEKHTEWMVIKWTYINRVMGHVWTNVRMSW